MESSSFIVSSSRSAIDRGAGLIRSARQGAYSKASAAPWSRTYAMHRRATAAWRVVSVATVPVVHDSTSTAITASSSTLVGWWLRRLIAATRGALAVARLRVVRALPVAPLVRALAATGAAALRRR